MKDALTTHEKKSKSIIIDGDLHSKFKLFCRGKSMKIGGVIEDLIRLYLENPKRIERLIEEFKEATFIAADNSKYYNDGSSKK